MNRNIKHIISIVLLSTTMLSLIGCGREDDNGYEPEVEIINVNIDKGVKNITELTKSEILGLSAEEVEKSVKTYLPSYREIYKIEENREMSTNDWITLRDIICIQFYGNARLEAEGSDEDDADSKYYAPKKSSIQIMTPSEFGKYLNELYTYMYGADYLKTNNLNFESMDAPSLNKMKEDFLSKLKD